MDLQRKQSLPSNKLATVMAKFDEMKTSGRMMPTATLAVGTMEGRRSSCREVVALVAQTDGLASSLNVLT